MRRTAMTGILLMLIGPLVPLSASSAESPAPLGRGIGIPGSDVMDTRNVPTERSRR